MPKNRVKQRANRKSHRISLYRPDTLPRDACQPIADPTQFVALRNLIREERQQRRLKNANHWTDKQKV
jgi:hypothetical protein